MDFAFWLSSRQALLSQKWRGGKGNRQKGSFSGSFKFDPFCPANENCVVLIFFNFFLKHFQDNAMIFNRKRKYRFNDRSPYFRLNYPSPIAFFPKNGGMFSRRTVLIFVKPALCIEI
jgi:hypothetical protein